MPKRVLITPLGGEYAGAVLGDTRLDDRLQQIVQCVGRDPGSTFPQALDTEAELEAFYRFINNDGFTPAAVLAPHVRATFERARKESCVVAVHDTTTVEYSTASPREGLGYTVEGRQGFYAHTSLLVTEDGTPLGVAHLETWTRTGTKARKRKASHRVMRQDKSRESMRWVRGVESIEADRSETGTVVHVTDAEGDFFELLAKIVGLSARFVIRAGQLDRTVETSGAAMSLREAIDGLKPCIHRDIELSERRHRKRRVARAARRKHPERSARTARVAIAATTVQIPKTRYSDVVTVPFDVHVVRIWETNPPRGEPPVEWVLFTREPIRTRKDLMRVVDIYRQRWIIEEYFKALKTGCSLEKRQIESYDALRNVLAIFAPIAYRLLLLRAVQRRATNDNARAVFSALELEILARAPSNRALPKPRSARDALQHLARLGGHLRNNGEPGWLVLGRGYEKLLLLRLGCKLAQEMPNICDQS